MDRYNSFGLRGILTDEEAVGVPRAILQDRSGRIPSGSTRRVLKSGTRSNWTIPFDPKRIQAGFSK